MTLEKLVHMAMKRQTIVESIQDNEETVVRHEDTPEEKIYMDLLNKKQDTLSKTAYTLFRVAMQDSYNYNLFHSYSYQFEEADEAMALMVLLASGITEQERKTLTEIVYAASLAALSIDPDGKALVGRKVDEFNLHWYYKTLSLTLNEVLQS